MSDHDSPRMDPALMETPSDVAAQLGMAATSTAKKQVASAAENWARIIRSTVREAPLASLTVGFLLGFLIARR